MKVNNMKYSNIICIGDSITNERDHYDATPFGDGSFLDEFDKRGYVFKEYAQVLGEYYNCPYQTIGKPGLTLPFTMMELIKNIDYILSLENPLVIFQFGVFFNATLKVDDNLDIMWKDLHGSFPGYDVVVDGQIVDNYTQNFVDSLESIDKLAMMTWFEKYEEFRNYWYIDEFITIANLINRMKKTDIFGFLHSTVKFKIPADYHILNMWDIGPSSVKNMQNISFKFPDMIDGHKTTEANENIANEIIRQVEINKNKFV